MARYRTVLAAAGLVAAIVATAWAFDAWVSRVPGDGGPDRFYRVSVTRDGHTLRRFTIAEMKQLGVRTLRMQGQDQTGVSLLRVLRAAGVRELKNVAVHGAGIRDTGYLWLTTDRITGDVLLSFARRGTVKLCGSRISQEDRVRDVTEIAVDAAARNKKSRQE